MMTNQRIESPSQNSTLGQRSQETAGIWEMGAVYTELSAPHLFYWTLTPTQYWICFQKTKPHWTPHHKKLFLKKKPTKNKPEEKLSRIYLPKTSQADFTEAILLFKLSCCLFMLGQTQHIKNATCPPFHNTVWIFPDGFLRAFYTF